MEAGRGSVVIGERTSLAFLLLLVAKVLGRGIKLAALELMRIFGLPKMWCRSLRGQKSRIWMKFPTRPTGIIFIAIGCVRRNNLSPGFPTSAA